MKQLFSILLIVLAQYSYSQPFTPLFQLDGPSTYVAVDAQQQLYVVRPNQALIQFNSQGDSLRRFQHTGFGSISYIDAQQPFQILLFFEAFSVIQILDQRLSLLQSINLLERYPNQITALALAPDRSLWIYDADRRRLQNINDFDQSIHESQDLSTLFNFEELPNRIWVHADRIYLWFPKEGVAIFDNFGAFLDFLPLPHSQIVHLENHAIWYLHTKNNAKPQLIRQNLKNFSKKNITPPKTQNPILQAIIKPPRLILRTKNAIKVYKY